MAGASSKTRLSPPLMQVFRAAHEAKDAAKIFDRLDMKILVDMASQINPRRMSDIMAQMSAEAAEKLTVELANRSGVEKAQAVPELPKIEGKPSGT